MAARKKSVAKKSTRNKSSKLAESSVMNMEAPQEGSSNSFDSTKVKRVGTKTKIALILAFVVIVAALYKGKGYFVAALVNNEPITRLSVISELEKRSGKQALDSLITQTLINQEAKKKGITVSQSEVDTEISKIEASVKSQNQDLDTLLSMQGMTKDDLISQIKTQKVVEKIFGSEIDPSDKDVDDYIKTNKDTLPKDKTQDEVKAQVKDQLRQQNLSTKFQTWITDLRNQSNIKYYVNY